MANYVPSSPLIKHSCVYRKMNAARCRSRYLAWDIHQAGSAVGRMITFSRIGRVRAVEVNCLAWDFGAGLTGFEQGPRLGTLPSDHVSHWRGMSNCAHDISNASASASGEILCLKSRIWLVLAGQQAIRSAARWAFCPGSCPSRLPLLLWRTDSSSVSCVDTQYPPSASRVSGYGSCGW